MKIDWFTFIAQVINFLVLMWLLKRYLYKPILKAIDERENKIRGELKDADIKRKNAEKEQAEFRQKNEAFDREKEEMLKKVVADANEQKQKLEKEIRKEANDLKAKLEKDLIEEQQQRGREISKRVTEEALAIARKILSDISSTSLEEQTVNTFIQKITSFSQEEKKKLVSALQTKSGIIQLRSAFKLSPGQKQDIENTIARVLGMPKCKFQFGMAPELISGIELTTNGYKLSWNLSEYIRELEKQFLKT